MVPTAMIAGTIAQAEWAASGNSNNTTIDQANNTPAARNCSRSTSLPPAMLPMIAPTPNRPTATGIQRSLMPVTLTRVGAR